MVENTTSEILTLLGNPIEREAFFDLMKDFCNDSVDYKITLDKTKLFLGHFSSYLKEKEFRNSVFQIIKLSYEICENVEDISDILIKTTLVNLMEIYINFSPLNNNVKESVLNILGGSFERLPPGIQVINICIMVDPIFKNKDYQEQKHKVEEEEVIYIEDISDIEVKIKEEMDAWIKTLSIDLDFQNELIQQTKQKVRSIAAERSLDINTESFKFLEANCVEMLTMQMTAVSLILDLGDEDLSPIPLNL